MAEYFYSLSGVLERDELQGGGDGIPVELWNVAVGASASIERGMLLGGDSTGVYSVVTSSVDASKPLVIAAVDYVGGTSAGVVQGYASGKFNRERIKLGGGSTLTLEPFEQELRKQNIHLTSIQDKFGR